MGKSVLIESELELLEYTAYKLIGEVVMLDKGLLNDYTKKERHMIKTERAEAKDASLMLRKESEILEHLEAKLPPSKAITKNLLKEPLFTQWVSRIFALLSCFEHMHLRVNLIFNELKKSDAVSAKLNKKITHLIREKSKLVNIMQDKAASIDKLKIDDKFKHELHTLTSAINL